MNRATERTGRSASWAATSPRTSALAARAVRVGVAVGAGIAARYIADRAQRRAVKAIPALGRRRVPTGLVDWTRAERLAVAKLERLPGRLTSAELAATAPAYAAAMARIVPILEARLGTPLPGVVERHEVVDRAGWARANLVTFRALIDRLEDRLIVPANAGRVGIGLSAVANRFLTSQQIGFLLGYIGGRVLGQYDVALLSAEHEPGRLLFVEENVRTTASTLGVPLDDFRTWIALHETTHAFEMEAHPWLRPYLKDHLERQVALFLDDAQSLQTKGLGPLLQRWRSAASGYGLAGLLSDEQRQLLRETQVLMSLLEGFSDWVMDQVGAEMLDDVTGIRERFEARRGQRKSGMERLVGRLTGMDLKLEQYRAGAQFVAGVAKHGGEEAISHLWDGPESLPNEAELRDPHAWVQRVVGGGSTMALPA
ncbi:MAG: zinc-dependent metalloprotease [Candidatus Limnocylindrales bacterium]